MGWSEVEAAGSKTFSLAAIGDGHGLRRRPETDRHVRWLRPFVRERHLDLGWSYVEACPGLDQAIDSGERWDGIRCGQAGGCVIRGWYVQHLQRHVDLGWHEVDQAGACRLSAQEIRH